MSHLLLGPVSSCGRKASEAMSMPRLGYKKKGEEETVVGE